MRRAVLTVLAGAALGAAVLPAAASAKKWTVYADAPNKAAMKALSKYDASVNAFFIKRITVNAGDAISFVNNGFHTFDFPGPSNSDLPLIVGHGTVENDRDAAGNLFWFNGKVPNLGINPQLVSRIGGSTYDGSARDDSGLPLSSKPTPFKLTFTKPGVYKYYCDVHPGMVGYVVVKAKGKKVPSAKADAAALSKQVKQAESIAKTAFTPKLGKDRVSLGSAGKAGVEDYAMFPRKLTVKKGTVVTFFMSKLTEETHTATFGPKAYLKTVANSITSPSPLQQAFYPSDNPALGPPLVSPTSHGNGFTNTGVLDRDPTTTIPASGKLKFGAPGTYHYICLIHPFMHGTIVVK